jgi:hypothetical protein
LSSNATETRYVRPTTSRATGRTTHVSALVALTSRNTDGTVCKARDDRYPLPDNAAINYFFGPAGGVTAEFVRECSRPLAAFVRPDGGGPYGGHGIVALTRIRGGSTRTVPVEGYGYAQGARTKFEEDIKVPFISVYSFSTTIPSPCDRFLTRLRDVGRAFPDLHNQLDRVRDSALLRMSTTSLHANWY